jgi:hypothetical protein
MDMQFVRAANDYWFQVSDRQVLALRGVSWSPNGSPSRSSDGSAAVVQPVPMLDWPATLFDDVIVFH